MAQNVSINTYKKVAEEKNVQYLKMPKNTYTENSQNGIIYSCKNCNYNTCKKSHYDKHLTTRKHLSLTKSGKNTYTNYESKLDFDKIIDENNDTKFVCSCGKQYKHRQSLYTHKKKMYF